MNLWAYYNSEARSFASLKMTEKWCAVHTLPKDRHSVITKSVDSVSGAARHVVFLQLVFDGVGEGLPRGFDDVLRAADRAPDRSFVPRLDYYTDTSSSTGLGIDHPNLIINQVNVPD
jgi:hypothetical protein